MDWRTPLGLTRVVSTVRAVIAATQSRPAMIDWDAVERAARERRGLPVPVSRRLLLLRLLEGAFELFVERLRRRLGFVGGSFGFLRRSLGLVGRPLSRGGRLARGARLAGSGIRRAAGLVGRRLGILRKLSRSGRFALHPFDVTDRGRTLPRRRRRTEPSKGRDTDCAT
jgi:hypothetical protein